MAHTDVVPVRPPDPLAVSVDAATRVSGIGRTRLYEAMSSGELASCKIGKRRLILLEDLRAWLAQQRRAETHPRPGVPASQSPASAGEARRNRSEVGQ
jgi:excisionase family DNA binding protein